ncbi:MAG: TonB-dependent receptor, partial [Gemmatimonadaceae bacterium]
MTFFEDISVIKQSRFSVWAIALALTCAGLGRAFAQGVTTGAVTGTVTDPAGAPIASAQVQVLNRATGFTAAGTTRENGSYFVQGLEVGGGYSVTVRRIGFQPETRDNITISLSQARRVDVQLAQQAVSLQTVEVRAVASDIAPTTMGSKTTVSDSAIQRLPTINRSLTDFIRLAPQVSQSGPGYSAGGMSNRMNNIQIDGATERDVFGLGSTGQPGAETGARTVSLEAVKELQVLLAPFDVRQGNFGGLLLNAVTKGGSNEIHGSVYHGFRNQSYGRNVPALRARPYDRTQWAFTLGGPIIRDRLHFFVAPEFQQEHQPVGGPFRGQVGASSPLQIADDSLTRFESIMNTKYSASPGTAGAVTISNPLGNVFARLDWRVNDIHRLVLRYNYSDGENLRQQNGRAQNRAVYSSNFHTFSIVKKAPVLQLYSNFTGGSFNELFLGYNNYRHRRVPELVFPQVTVTVPRVGGGNATIVGGADQFSMKNELDTETYELTDNFTIPLGSHNLTIGTRNELVKLRNQFNQSSYGVWTFTNLTNFDNGVASSFRKAFILQNDGNVFFDALQTALYVQDQWQVRSNLNFTLGLRADVSSFLKNVGYSAPIDSAYGRRTDDIPKRSVQFSPRVGFNWDIGGDQTNQLRGGVGLFVGTPPYVWMENAYINNGLTTVFLNCNTGGSRDPAPPFRVDPSGIVACGNGAGSAPIGAVNFLAKDLKFPQPFRGTLGFDRQLAGNLVVTVEGLFSKTLNQLFFVNRNLVDPRGVDKRGRVLYGDTIRVNGQALPSLPPRVIANGGASRFSEAFDIINQSKDYAYNLTFQLQKRYSNNWEGMLAYTRSRARDVQSFTSSTHVSNWAFGRTYSGNQLDPYTSISLFDQPHKFIMSGTRTVTPFGDLATDISFFLQRVSGPPFDYVYGAGSASGSGDLN